MLDIERSEDILDGEVLDADEPACVELVPVTQSVHWSPKAAARPDPSFVTHLIATADQAPQTRSLRRASLADAQTAYGASQERRSGTGGPGKSSRSDSECEISAAACPASGEPLPGCSPGDGTSGEVRPARRGHRRRLPRRTAGCTGFGSG